MKTIFLTLFMALLFASFAVGQDSTQNRGKQASQQKAMQHFVDKNGDGYNDNAPDHDGDGVPNSLDPDWQKMRSGKDKKKRYIDMDGDGINDFLQDENPMFKVEQSKFNEPKHQNKGSMEEQSGQHQGHSGKKHSGKR